MKIPPNQEKKLEQNELAEAQNQNRTQFLFIFSFNFPFLKIRK